MPQVRLKGGRVVEYTTTNSYDRDTVVVFGPGTAYDIEPPQIEYLIEAFEVRLTINTVMIWDWWYENGALSVYVADRDDCTDDATIEIPLELPPGEQDSSMRVIGNCATFRFVVYGDEPL